MTISPFSGRSTPDWDLAGARFEAHRDGPVALLRSVAAVVRRHALKLLLWTLACTFLAAFYVRSVEPSYTATATILLEPRGTVAANSEGVLSPTFDIFRAEGEIQIIVSERLLSGVFRRLELERDAEFSDETRSRFSGLSGLLSGVWGTGAGTAPEPSAMPAMQPAAEVEWQRKFSDFARRVDVRRIGQSYVLGVSFTSSDPTLAHRVANAIVAAYLWQSVDLKARAAQGGSVLLQGRLDSLIQQVSEADASIARGSLPDAPMPDADARVIGEALPPLAPSAPRTKLVIAAGGILGLMSGLFVIALVHLFDRRIRTGDELVAATGLPLLAAIPRTRRARRRMAGPKARSFALSRPGSPFAKAVRDLRTSLSLAARTAQCGDRFVVAFVASTPGSGTTLLAASFAQIVQAGGQAVTLIDGDMVRPSRGRDADGDQEISNSLADALAHGLAAEHVAYENRGGIAWLRARSRDATTNLVADLGTPEMGRLLKHAVLHSTVVLDLPPLRLSADAKAASRLADVVVLVADAGKSTSEDVRGAVRALQEAGARLAGVVLNKVP